MTEIRFTIETVPADLKTGGFRSVPVMTVLENGHVSGSHVLFEFTSESQHEQHCKTDAFQKFARALNKLGE